MREIVSCFVLPIGLILGWALNGSCAPISYSEGLDGELSEFFDNPVMYLDYGVNTVVGQIYNDYTAEPYSNDKDSFAFVVESGMVLNSLTWEFETAYTDGNPDNYQGAVTYYQLMEHTPEGWLFYVSSSGAVDLLSSSPIDLFPNLGTLGPGTYAVYQGKVGGGVGDAWYTDYTFSFDVGSTIVPVPSTVLLLGSGIACLAVFRRRSR